MVEDLHEGEALGMNLDRRIFQLCPNVTDYQEFLEFDSQVNDGSVVLKGFYAIPAVEFKW